MWNFFVLTLNLGHGNTDYLETLYRDMSENCSEKRHYFPALLVNNIEKAYDPLSNSCKTCSSHKNLQAT